MNKQDEETIRLLDDIKKLMTDVERLSSKAKSAAGKVAQARQLRVDTEAAAKTALDNVRRLVSMDHLLAPGGMAVNLPSGAEQEVRTWRAMSTQAEVVPGILAQAERELKEAEADLEGALPKLLSCCEKKAAADETALRGEIEGRMQIWCAHDRRGAREVVDIVVERSNARAWRQVLRRRGGDPDVLAAARAGLMLADRFLGGGPACPTRAAAPASSEPQT
jgi:hypothetical protein